MELLGRLPPRTKDELRLERGLYDTHIKLEIRSLNMVSVKPGIPLIDNDDGNKFPPVNKDGACLLLNPDLLIKEGLEKTLHMLGQYFFS